MKRELKVLVVVLSLFTFAGGLFGPIYAIFVEQIGGNLLDAGGAYAIFSIVAGVLMYLMGRWEDHLKHVEKLIVIGYALNVLGFVGYLMVRTPMDLFIVQIVFGISVAVNTPAFDRLYSNFLDKGKYASEWGMLEAQDYIMTGVAAIVGAFLAQTYGFTVLFQIMIIISIVGVMVSLLLLKKGGK